MAAIDAGDARTFVLRDGRAVRIAAPSATATFTAEVERLIGAADASRADVYRAAARDSSAADAPGLALAAYDAESGKLIGVIAYAASGELAGVVEAHFRGVGLGTLLVHQAAERARKAGVEVLHVELHPGSEDTAAMLRDSGFATHWDIDYPIARVALQLTSGPRPGWTTPKPRAADGA